MSKTAKTYSTPEAAKLIGISLATVHRWSAVVSEATTEDLRVMWETQYA